MPGERPDPPEFLKTEPGRLQDKVQALFLGFPEELPQAQPFGQTPDNDRVRTGLAHPGHLLLNLLPPGNTVGAMTASYSRV